ncbi:autophagy-related 17 isoform X3 [Oratosquilla oratoria]|uniref:autophagy-related 17 isoform X3 n=1 Tax=Oratosquilla oratoria TaxID=337810 RepID=UPI003F7711FD
MLYVFFVDTGTIMTFDMDLALGCVSALKCAIQRSTGIPQEKQVLLISGGEALDHDARVCQYSAGTDTNPIFLFSKLTLEGQTPAPPFEDHHVLDHDVREQVEGALSMPPSYNTVAARTQLAQQMYEYTLEQEGFCGRLVHDQHLQQQGWAAVVANLEDLVAAAKEKFRSFESSFQDFLGERDEKFKILDNFNDDIALLAKIPILPGLLKRESSREKLDQPLEEPEESCAEGSKLSLLDWISAKDINRTVGGVVEECQRGLSQIDSDMYRVLISDVTGILKDADRPDLKEIGGLEDRLFGLEQLLHEAKKTVEEQNTVAQSMLLNQERAGKVNDPSIFPDLCDSHRKNLKMMLTNLNKVLDIKRRCVKAKGEFSQNIRVRLMWVMMIQKKLDESYNKLVLHREHLLRLGKMLDVLQQIHLSPQVYMAAVTEVVRRHSFSQSFMEWAIALSKENNEVWEKEVRTRQEFLHKFSSHFLSCLFPGLDDLPPKFAIEPPPIFDDTLPKLGRDDIASLRSILPELASMLIVGEVAAVPPLLQAAIHSTATTTVTPRESSGEMYTSAVTTTNLSTPRNTPEREGSTSKSRTRPSTLAREPHESETDTEEFEKVCGSVSDGAFSPMEDVCLPLQQVRPDSRSVKTKQHFAAATDSKHIRLDSTDDTASARVAVTVSSEDEKMTSRIQCATDTAANISPNERIQSPESLLTSQEFVTAEFYIDESMPSSYTESNGTNGTNASGSGSQGGGGRHHSNLVKSHHVVTAELQKQLEEKTDTIISLQADLTENKEEMDRLRSRLSALTNIDYQGEVISLKTELSSLRDKVQDDSASYVNYISELSSRLLDVLLKIQQQTSADQSLAVSEAVSKAKEDQEQLTMEMQGRMDLQAHKLSDAQREIEIYQEQLHRQAENLQHLSAEFEETKRTLVQEKEEDIKRLTLEHELEMEALKEQWAKDDGVNVKEIGELKQKLIEVENTLETVKRHRDELEKNFHDKFEAHFLEEKDKIVQILEVSFTEREKKALEALKEKLLQEHQEAVERMANEKEMALQTACEGIRSRLESEFKEEMEKQKNELSEKHLVEIAQVREQWLAEKEEEIKVQIQSMESRCQSEQELALERVKQQYKMELEGLRSRFRMMTTASMDKSPSETSLERYERGDLIEATCHEAALTRMREELEQEKVTAVEEIRKALEEQHRFALEEEHKKNEERRKEERRRIEAENQVVFNEAIQSVIQGKEKVIEDLRLRVSLLTEESEKKKRMSGGEMTDQMLSENRLLKEKCEAHLQEIHRLEAEVVKAKRLSFTTEKMHDLNSSFSMASPSALAGSGGSIAATSPETVRKLQQENQELREKLSQSATSLLERGKISIKTCQQGDAVLLVWDEQYQHYRVLLEGNQHFYFLHSDSYALLGLSREAPRKLYCTAEVVNKEFCQAKKDENRFRVPKGTKFYRVTCRSWDSDEATGATSRHGAPPPPPPPLQQSQIQEPQATSPQAQLPLSPQQPQPQRQKSQQQQQQ